MTEDDAERKQKTYKVNQADGEQEESCASSFASWFEEQDQVVQFRFILGWQVFSYARIGLILLHPFQAICHDD